MFLFRSITQISSGLICVHLWLFCSLSAGAEAIRLTKDGSFKQHLQWSPDGKKFLFTRIYQGKMGLWTINADGTGAKRLFPHDEGPDFDGHWSPDSKKIVFIYDILQGT